MSKEMLLVTREFLSWAKMPAELRSNTYAIVTLLVLALPHPAFSQSEELMQRELDRALERSIWEIGPFHLTPSMRSVFGYDSNAVLDGDLPNPDVSARFGPGLNAVLPFGDRVLMELYEELGFVYYQDLEELRDIFDVTRVGGAFGGKNLVVQVANEFRDEKVQPSREFDVPVDQRSNLLSTTLDLSVGWRQELRFEYERHRVIIQDSELTVRGIPIKSLLDRLEQVYRAELIRHLTTDTAGFVEGYHTRQDYDDESVERNATGYGFGGGFRFSPTGNVRGEARLAFKQLVPESTQQLPFRGLVGRAGLEVGLGQRFSVEGLYLRDVAPSVLGENLVVVTSVYGGFLDIYFGSRFSLRPGFRFGYNNYPGEEPTTSDGSTEDVLIRHFNILSVNLLYRLAPAWRVDTGITFSTRETSSPSAPRDRFVANFGLTIDF